MATEKGSDRLEPLHAAKRTFVRLRLMAVFVGVVLAGLGCVMHRVVLMAARDVGMVPGLFMLARGMVLGGFTVMDGSVFVVLRSFIVMVDSLLGHGIS